MKRLISIFVLLLGVTVACSPAPTATPSFPTGTPVPVSPTTLPPTNTSIPATLTSTTIPSQTATFTPTETAQPSETPKPTLIPIPPEALQGEILFSIYPDGDIAVMDANGGNRRILLNRPTDFAISTDRHASWMPNNMGISYMVDDFLQAEIWVMDNDGQNQRLLIGEVASASSHAWSPDGKWLAYVSMQNKIMRYNLASQTSTPLTDGRFRLESAPDWSPDGLSIAFAATDATGNQDIYTIQTDGSDLTRVTNHPADDQYPDWSPDGLKIAFSSTRDGDHIKDIFVIDLTQGREEDGNLPWQVTTDENLQIDPDWSPDGEFILYASHTFGAAHATLFITDALGKQIFQLTEENTYHSPKWH